MSNVPAGATTPSTSIIAPTTLGTGKASVAADDLSGTDNLLDAAALAKAAQTASGSEKEKEKEKGKATKPVQAVSGNKLVEPASPKRKKKDLLPKPELTVRQAIDKGIPPVELTALAKKWTKYKLQQAQIEAQAEANALIKLADKARREAADELLKIADGYGISMADAKTIYEKALATKYPDKAPRK